LSANLRFGVTWVTQPNLNSFGPNSTAKLYFQAGVTAPFGAEIRVIPEAWSDEGPTNTAKAVPA
jgi:hypothetical protein